MRVRSNHCLGAWRVGLVLLFLVVTQQQPVMARSSAPEPPWVATVSPEIIASVNRLYAQSLLVRLEAISELTKAGANSAAAAPFLIPVLSDRTVVIVPDRTVLGKHEVRIAEAARRALVAIGSAAVPVLRPAVRSSPNTDTRALAAQAMHEIIFEPHAHGVTTRYEVDEPCLELWLVAMNDTDGRVRRYAAEGLARAGTESAVPALLKALNDECRPVSLAAVKGLGRLKSKEAVGPLIGLLGREDLRNAVREAFGNIGAPAVQPLILVIADKDCQYRENACWALHRVRDPDALPFLHQALQHDDPLVRQWATSTLAVIKDPRSIGPLLEALEDRVTAVRMHAASSLGQIRDEKGETTAPLMKVLRTDSAWEARNAAAWALWRLSSRKGTRDATVIRALSEAAEGDENDTVRKTASELLAKLKH